MKTTEENAVFMKKFLAMMVGNMMEMFDFAVFGALVDIIGKQFFPEENKTLQLLQVLSIFGAAFVMRPLGGIMMGWLGDTAGRKKALEVSVALMLFPSFLIGCLPTYSQVGVISTVLLLLLRIMQGLAVGGEVVGSYVFTIEATNGVRTGFWGACCKASGLLGNVLGLGFSTLLRATLTTQQMNHWGWRVPFLCGILFGVLGLHLRGALNKLHDYEGEEYRQVQCSNTVIRDPLYQAMRTHWREIIVILLAAAFWGVMFYSCFVWLIYFMSNESLAGGRPVNGAWFLFFTMNVLLVIAMPIAGFVADVVGTVVLQDIEKGIRVTLMTSLLLTLCSVVPAFALISSRTISGCICGQILLVIPTALYGGNLPAFMVSLFAPHLRYTGVGLGYNLSQCIFTSTITMIQTALVLSPSSDNNLRVDSDGVGLHWKSVSTLTGLCRVLSDSRVYPAYYIMSVAVLSLATLYWGPHWIKTHRQQVATTTLKNLELAPTVTVDTVYAEQWPEDIARSNLHTNRYCIIEENPEEVH